MSAGASWNTDAQFIDEINPELIWTNGAINSFLRGNERFIIVAAKGMGKTLLMRHKRKLLEGAHDGSLSIPRNKMSDYVTLGGVLPKDLISSMKDVKFWQDVWEISIAISVLLNFPHRLSDNEKVAAASEIGRAVLPSTLAADLLNALNGVHREERVPSSVLVMLFKESKSHIEQARTITLPIIHDLCVRYVASACYVFIDSFDQALNDILPGEIDVWCAGQCGLMRAAWELSRHNRHLKVFATIRQEAYASFRNAETLNIQGSVLLIEYLKEDLHQIFDRAVKHYEQLDSIEEFVGLKKVYNGYLQIYEGVFDYIFRHIIGSPRWLMILGQKLSDSLPSEQGTLGISPPKRQKAVTNLVNEESSNKLAMDYLTKEMQIFFRGADVQHFVSKLIASINSTVLSLSNMQRLSAKFINDGAWRGTEHPFCLLFNLGLLGYVEHEPSSRDRRQTFKKPYEFNWSFEEIMPRNPASYYLLHPCLHHAVQQRNPRFSYNRVRIGDELPWTEKDDEIIAQEKIKIFVSYSHADWAQVEPLVDMLEDLMNLKTAGHDIWLDRWKLQGGRWIQDQISEGLKASDFLLPVFSANSLRSAAVAVEWKTKFAAKFHADDDKVLPVLLEGIEFNDLPDYLRNIWAYKYDGSIGTLQRIVDDLLFWKSERDAAQTNKKPGRRRVAHIPKARDPSAREAH